MSGWVNTPAGVRVGHLSEQKHQQVQTSELNQRLFMWFCTISTCWNEGWSVLLILRGSQDKQCNPAIFLLYAGNENMLRTVYYSVLCQSFLQKSHLNGNKVRSRTHDGSYRDTENMWGHSLIPVEICVWIKTSKISACFYHRWKCYNYSQR